MRVYKSPVQLKPSNMQKKSSINFVKNVAAPKQVKTQHIYTNSSNGNFSDNSIQKSTHTPFTIHQKYHPQNHKQSYSMHITIHRRHTQSSKTRQIKSSIITAQPIRTIFPYNNHTQVRQLIGFIHLQVQDNMIFVKSENIYVDYILGLKSFRVKNLVEMINDEMEQGQGQGENIVNGRKKNQLEVTCCEYENVEQNNYLRNFEIIKCVGSGGFSKVFLVRGFGKLMAMKVINKQYILSNDKANIINNQKTILSICSQHPFITKLQTSFQTNNYLIFVMEFCNGGQLFNLLRKVRRMKQQDAKFYFVQTLSAIVYLHRKGIVYRDIKPENIIIDHEGHVRLADYGLSKIMEQTRQAKTYSFCGSAQYMAPQMLLKKGHSFEIDFYCLGALLYELVIGLPPYYSRNQTQLFSNIIHNDLEFPPHVQLSIELKNFLSCLLQKQVQHRYNTIEQILSDPWMHNINLQHVMQKRLKPPFETDMFAYNFDDTDFAQQEKEMLQKLHHQQTVDSFDNIKFPDFFYESKQITDLKSVILKSKHQGIFVRSLNQGIGQFVAQSYLPQTQSRKVTNSGSIIMNTHSREPSVNRLDQSGIKSIPTSSQITRRIDMSNIFATENHSSGQVYSSQIHNSQIHSSQNKINYFPSNMIPKSQLNSVRSLQHINTSKSSMTNNRSQQRINSIGKHPSHQQLPYTNIYTSHKQPFHPFGIKLTTPTSTLISSSQQHIRTPNYYSVQKSSSRGNGIQLDINDLRIKNQRNFSMERPRQNLSVNNLTIGGTPHSANGSMTYLKHAVSAYEIKKSYIDGFRDKNLSGKVKKSPFKNGEKISISMLNNLHYRN